MPSDVVSIGETKVTLRDGNGREQDLRNDAVIVLIGGTPPGQLLSQFGVEVVTEYGEVLIRRSSGGRLAERAQGE